MHRLTGAGDKNLKAPSKNFYVPIYVPKLKARFYLIVFKRFANPLTPFFLPRSFIKQQIFLYFQYVVAYFSSFYPKKSQRVPTNQRRF